MKKETLSLIGGTAIGAALGVGIAAIINERAANNFTKYSIGDLYAMKEFFKDAIFKDENEENESDLFPDAHEGFIATPDIVEDGMDYDNIAKNINKNEYEKKYSPSKRGNLECPEWLDYTMGAETIVLSKVTADNVPEDYSFVSLYPRAKRKSDELKEMEDLFDEEEYDQEKMIAELINANVFRNKYPDSGVMDCPVWLDYTNGKEEIIFNQITADNVPESLSFIDSYEEAKQTADVLAEHVGEEDK